MNVFRTLRLWPMLALFALLCLASTPATAWACACHMAAQVSASHVASNFAPVSHTKIVQGTHSCCSETLLQTVTPKQTNLAPPSPLMPNGGHKGCCCHADDHSGLPAGEKMVWSGWNFVAFAIAPPVVFVLESPVPVASVYSPVAQSPPEAPPIVARRGRAPPVLAA